MAYTITYETNADLPTGVSVNINLTRGDYLPLTIEMEKEDEAFTPNTGSLRFALKKKYKNSDTELLLNKAIPLDTRLLELEGDDTSNVYATYSNGTLTINTVSNTSARRFRSGQTYNYRLVKWT